MTTADLDALCRVHHLRAVMVGVAGERPLIGGDAAAPNNVHSIRKSLLSILIGQLVDAGRLDIDSPIGEFGIDDDALLTPAERGATVRHLLMSSSGIYLEPATGFGGPLDPSSVAPRPPRGAHRPGTKMIYNNWDFNVLGNIFERVTGTSVFLALDRRIAKPIGMQDWDPYLHGRYSYVADPIGGDRRFPNFRMQLSARDLYRLGSLMLHEGMWGTRSLVSREWVATSTSRQIATELDGDSEGYGYLWWIAGPSGTGLTAGSFSAFGFGGQLLTVDPSRSVVMVGLVDTSTSFKELTGSQRESVYASLLESAGAG